MSQCGRGASAVRSRSIRGCGAKKNTNAEQTTYAVTEELRSLAIVSGTNTRVLFCTQWRLFVWRQWRQLANLPRSISEQQRRRCTCEKLYLPLLECVCNLRSQESVWRQMNWTPPQQYSDVTGCIFSYSRDIRTVFDWSLSYSEFSKPKGVVCVQL